MADNGQKWSETEENRWKRIRGKMPLICKNTPAVYCLIESLVHVQDCASIRRITQMFNELVDSYSVYQSLILQTAFSHLCRYGTDMERERHKRTYQRTDSHWLRTGETPALMII